MNTFKTALLLTALTLFLIFIGGHFGGRNGMVLAFLVAAGMNFFSYFYSDKMTGAHVTGNPYALASALQKLDAYSKRLPMQASASTAHLFIVAPFLSGASLGNLFSTHPPMARRIERLTGRTPYSAKA